MEPATVGGIVDLWKLWRSGKIAEALKLWDAIQSKDVTLIAAELGEILAMFGQPEYAVQLNELAAAIKSGSIVNILVEGADVLKLVANDFAANPPPPIPGDVIRMMASADFEARKPIAEMTAAECSQWFKDNTASVRTAAGYSFTKWVLRRLPEVRDSLTGDAMAVAKVQAMDPDTVIKWLNRAILVLTAASAFYPPLLVIVTVLKMVLARYESNNPVVGLAVGELAG